MLSEVSVWAWAAVAWGVGYFVKEWGQSAQQTGQAVDTAGNGVLKLAAGAAVIYGVYRIAKR